MRRFLFQTVRPISFVAWIPAFVGSLLAHNFSWHVLTTCFGVMVAVGLANAFNNVVDRKIDRHNQSKDTLAVTKPVMALFVVLIMAPFLALALRETGYDYRLLSVLFYTSVFYSLVFSRLRAVKRLVVATIVAATAFLAVDSYPPQLWLWACLVWVFIFLRETRKDKADLVEDTLKRFRSWHHLTADWWFVLAPLVGAAIYLVAVCLNGHRPDESDEAIAMGVALTVLAYALIRIRNGWYKVKLHGNVVIGIAGLALALSGLMPPFATGAVKLLVIFNLASIFVRAICLKSVDLRPLANLHDAWLWASLLLLAMSRYQSFPVTCSLLAVLLLIAVFAREFHRLKLYRLSLPAPAP